MVEMGLMVNVKFWSNTGAQAENSVHELRIFRKVKKKSVKEAFVVYLYLVLGTLKSDFFL